jgi:hypothetical protein
MAVVRIYEVGTTQVHVSVSSWRFVGDRFLTGTQGLLNFSGKWEMKTWRTRDKLTNRNLTCGICTAT